MACAMSPAVTDLDEMSLNSFKMWTDMALKIFLEVRGKSVEGSHDELAARYLIFIILMCLFGQTMVALAGAVVDSGQLRP